MANIRTARRSGFLTRGGVKRRETVWLGVTDTETTLTPANPVLINALNAAALALRPFTVVRARGFIYVRSDQIAASESFGAALGVAVVSDEARAIGVTAIPTPITEDSSDLWFTYESIAGFSRFGDATGFGNEGSGRTYDSRAMLKVE